MEQGKGGGAQPWRGQGRSGRDVLGAEGPKIAMNDSIKAAAEPTDDQNPPAPPRKKARVDSDGAAECCSSCGTPWNVSDQEEWLRNAFYTNFRNGDAATIQRVREFGRSTCTSGSTMWKTKSATMSFMTRFPDRCAKS